MSDSPELYQGPGPNSEAFDPKQHYWDGREWWTQDRLHWWDGIRWQRWDAPHVSGLAPEGVAQPPTPRVRRPGYWRDFWLGFAGTIAGNIVLAILLNVLASANLGDAMTGVIVAAPWVLNIGALIVFAIIRSRVAIGMLVAYAAGFGLVLLAGIFLAVLCFGGAMRFP